MDQATQFVQSNSSILTTLVFLVVILAILYAVYTYLYPADDPTYTQFLRGEADARHKVVLKKARVPAIYTGGDFTLSFWIYIDDWNYMASKSKFLFAISPERLSGSAVSPLVGLLTPLKNGLMVRAATVGRPGSAAVGSAGPDVNVESVLQSVLNQQSSHAMFESTVDTPCDIKDVPLQRWTCVTIVSSGRVLDVYMDGKLSRSCVLENVLNVPRGPLSLRLGESGGFGGRYSSIQMWNQQLTPDVIYGIYQMGPSQAQHNIFTDITKYLNLNVTFTGPAAAADAAPGQPPAPSNPFNQLYSEAQGDLTSAYSSVTSNGQALMARL